MIKIRKTRWMGRGACMREEGIVGEYFEVGKYEIGRFFMYIVVVCFLMGNSTASEFYMPTFRNTLFHLHKQVVVLRMTMFEKCWGI